MIEELVQKLSQKTGLPPDKAEEVVNLVVSHLKHKLPRRFIKRSGQPSFWTRRWGVQSYCVIVALGG
jgi:hypothetical protein